MLLIIIIYLCYNIYLLLFTMFKIRTFFELTHGEANDGFLENVFILIDGYYMYKKQFLNVKIV